MLLRGAAVTWAGLLLASSAFPAGSLSTLQPGQFRTISQQIPVNIVFVGYEPGAGPTNVDLMKFTGQLPAGYQPINRYKAFYGLPAASGLAYQYKYNLVWANQTFENAFFGVQH